MSTDPRNKGNEYKDTMNVPALVILESSVNLRFQQMKKLIVAQSMAVFVLSVFIALLLI